LISSTTIGESQDKLRIDKDETILYIIINLDTSSCGSFQIRNGELYKGSCSSLTQNDKDKIFNYILDNYGEDMNHIFFIDKENGVIETLFNKYFKEGWSYKNYNTENTVKVWNYNKWTDDEVKEKLKREYEEEDYDDESW